MKSNRNGFTMIELLVVVTIIALLSGIGLATFQSANRDARDAKRKGDLEQIRSALEICRAETGSYPGWVGNTIVCDGQVYLDPVPKDPRTGRPGFSYTYTRTSTTEYTLCATTMESQGESSPYCVKNP